MFEYIGGAMMADKQIGDYKILEHIGSGGMAKVYLAVHKDVPNLKVVLKVLSHAQHADRFKQEADKLALLDRNPNICKIRHFFNHGEEFVIAMEHIDGPSLEEILEREVKPTIPEALKIVLDMLTALQPAHEKGIYHRDIKPSNIMFTTGGQLKIIDFGIAKGKTDPQLTIIGTAAGTPEYMAPEQFEAAEDVDYSKCDIYAAGTILYRMVTGELPFKGDNMFLLRDSKMINTPETPSKLNNEVSKELDGIIIKSISSDPAKRFESVAEMKTRLQDIYIGYQDVVPEVKTAEVKQPRGGKRGSPKALAAAALIVAAAIVVYAAIRWVPGLVSRGERSEPAAVVDTTDTRPASPETAEGRRPEDATDDDPARNEPSTSITPSAPATTPPASRPAPGSIQVGSVPRNGDIYIDGVLQDEKTPFTFDNIAPGRHTVRIVVTVDGESVDTVYTVTVASGRTIKRVFRPEK